MIQIVDTDFNAIPLDYTSDEYADIIVLPVLRQCQSNIKVMWCTSVYHKPLDAEAINESDVDLVVIAASDHPIHPEHPNLSGLDSLRCKYLLLGPNHDFTFHPYWSIYYPKSVNIAIPSMEKVLNANRKYKFSCLNGHPSYARIINLIHMLENQVFNDSVITFNIVDTAGPNSQLDVQGMENQLSMNCPEYVDSFMELVGKLPINHPEIQPMPKAAENHLLFNVPLQVMNVAYTDSYINVITESAEDFISEKSIKPLLAGQLFTSISNQSTMNLLREMGIDTFDDIFDNHRYGEISDIHSRIRAMHEYLAGMSGTNMQELFESTRGRRVANRELILSGKIEKIYHANVIKFMENI